DIAVTAVSAPANVTQGASVNVGVTVKNVGNQNVGVSFDVTLQDVTDAATIGTQTVPGLAAGASATLTFAWNTTGSSLGSHTLNGPTVTGHWSVLGLNSTTCTTGDLGGNGTCSVLFPSLRRTVTSVNFTVVSVTLAGRVYDRTLNHDPDGDSNGTTIRVNRP